MRPPLVPHPLLTLISYTIGLQSTPKIQARLRGFWWSYRVPFLALKLQVV